MTARPDLDRLRSDVVFQERLRDHDFHFRSTWGLFSPRSVDEGSRLLLDHLEIGVADNCLDLGCGYGPIGLTMARLAPQGQTLMVDKDYVAVDYANANAKANHLANAKAVLSNGFSAVPAGRNYRIIASNIPAKVGKELLTLMLWDACDRLVVGGGLYVVTINGLRQFMKRNLNEVFGNYDKLKQGKNYTVAMARYEG
ncbi:MAG: methyltransferase [Chromatiales bacterium]|nr:methyltransferase [Chromatiales bacterium]